MALHHIGKTFGKYTVLDSFVTRTKAGNPKTKFKVRCACGLEKEILADNVLRGSSTQCSDCAKKSSIEKSANGYKHPAYKAWCSMLQRCFNENSKYFHLYGGRGISVCDSWRQVRSSTALGSINGFRQFAADMGERPPAGTLDRVDVNSNYEPGNCRWATMLTQANNKQKTERIEFDGKSLTRSEWAAELRVPTTWYVLAEKYKIPLAEALSKIKMANPQVGRFSWQELYGVERQNPMHKPNKERRENPLLSEENLARFRKMFE